MARTVMEILSRTVKDLHVILLLTFHAILVVG